MKHINLLINKLNLSFITNKSSKVLTILILSAFTQACSMDYFIKVTPAAEQKVTNKVQEPVKDEGTVVSNEGEEQRKQEEQKRLEEEKRKQEEEQKRLEEEQRKQEEQKRLEEEQRKQEEEQKRLEEEKRKQEEQKRLEEEKRKQEEQKRLEEEKRKQEEQKRLEEEKRKKEEQKRREEEERRRQEEEKRKRTPIKQIVPKSLRHMVPNEVDVLVVGDNSASMSPEQKEMSLKFNNFLSNISELDWRVAITTTDISKNEIGKQGNLFPFARDLYYIERSTQGAQDLFAKTITGIGILGDGNERGIAAMNLAIRRNQSPQTPENMKWMRSNAHLAVIVLSDEDSCGKSGVCPNSLPYVEKDIDTPASVKKNVREYLGANKTFSVHSIIIKVGDTNCMNIQKRQKSRASGEALAASYGKNYTELSNMTHGIVGSVCEKSYATQLVNMAEKIKQHIGGIKLDCSPKVDDQNPVKVAVQGQEIATEDYTIEGDQIFFKINLNANAEILVNYSCEELVLPKE